MFFSTHESLIENTKLVYALFLQFIHCYHITKLLSYDIYVIFFFSVHQTIDISLVIIIKANFTEDLLNSSSQTYTNLYKLFNDSVCSLLRYETKKKKRD